jgi:hypothetical protein
LKWELAASPDKGIAEHRSSGTLLDSNHTFGTLSLALSTQKTYTIKAGKHNLAVLAESTNFTIMACHGRAVALTVTFYGPKNVRRSGKITGRLVTTHILSRSEDAGRSRGFRKAALGGRYRPVRYVDHSVGEAGTLNRVCQEGPLQQPMWRAARRLLHARVRVTLSVNAYATYK